MGKVKSKPFNPFDIISKEQSEFEKSIGKKWRSLSKVERRKRFNNAKDKLHQAMKNRDKRFPLESSINGEGKPK